jgi:hypothetical protein
VLAIFYPGSILLITPLRGVNIVDVRALFLRTVIIYSLLYANAYLRPHAADYYGLLQVKVFGLCVIFAAIFLSTQLGMVSLGYNILASVLSFLTILPLAAYILSRHIEMPRRSILCMIPLLFLGVSIFSPIAGILLSSVTPHAYFMSTISMLLIVTIRVLRIATLLLPLPVANRQGTGVWHFVFPGPRSGSPRYRGDDFSSGGDDFGNGGGGGGGPQSSDKQNPRISM